MAVATDPRLQELKGKYSAVFRVIEQQGVSLQNVHVQDNKLFIKGAAPSEEAKNKVWDSIKQVDAGYSDLTADITVDSSLPKPAGSQPQTQAGGETYTVKAGDSLSKIAKQYYGDANAYMKIFDANKDKLKDPNMIQPGQVLTIPPK